MAVVNTPRRAAYGKQGMKANARMVRGRNETHPERLSQRLPWWLRYMKHQPVQHDSHPVIGNGESGGAQSRVCRSSATCSNFLLEAPATEGE